MVVLIQNRPNSLEVLLSSSNLELTWDPGTLDADLFGLRSLGFLGFLDVFFNSISPLPKFLQLQLGEDPVDLCDPEFRKKQVLKIDQWNFFFLIKLCVTKQMLGLKWALLSVKDTV